MKRALLVILPFTITYAIVSSIGTEGNYYGPPTNPNLVDQSVPNPVGN